MTFIRGMKPTKGFTGHTHTLDTRRRMSLAQSRRVREMTNSKKAILAKDNEKRGV